MRPLWLMFPEQSAGGEAVERMTRCKRRDADSRAPGRGREMGSASFKYEGQGPGGRALFVYYKLSGIWGVLIRNRWMLRYPQGLKKLGK